MNTHKKKACTLEQAKMIVGCRPFKDADDMKSKLRKKKGVNSGILTHYQDMMKVRSISNFFVFVLHPPNTELRCFYVTKKGLL
jgi:hypothetical protein